MFSSWLHDTYFSVHIAGVEPVTDTSSPMNQLVESTANLATLQRTATEVNVILSVTYTVKVFIFTGLYYHWMSISYTYISLVLGSLLLFSK